MKEGLSIKFNHKAPKEIKTEDDLKVGVRTEADGSRIHVRGGKIINRQQTHGEKQILNEYRKAATEVTEAIARKHQAVRAHHKPEAAPTP
ncbi:MAG: hypothetical protein ACRD8O_18180 [Bryobacteraceae bacterium]